MIANYDITQKGIFTINLKMVNDMKEVEYIIEQEASLAI
jgi:hypothetical protein